MVCGLDPSDIMETLEVGEYNGLRLGIPNLQAAFVLCLIRVVAALLKNCRHEHEFRSADQGGELHRKLSSAAPLWQLLDLRPR